MSVAITLATARRVLAQLRHDPRIDRDPGARADGADDPAALRVQLRGGVQPGRARPCSACSRLVLMFIITSVTTLRERSSGTLERLMTTPLAKLDLLVGIRAGVCALRAACRCSWSWASACCSAWMLAGSVGWLLLATTAAAVLGIALGLLASAFARTEFQAIQLMPVVLFPQLLLCGLFAPRDRWRRCCSGSSNVLPMSYAVEAIQQVTTYPSLTASYVRGALVVAGCAVAALVLAATSLRRRTD